MARQRSIMVLAVLLLASAAAPLQAQEKKQTAGRMTLTLDQAITVALERNHDMMAAEKDRYKADEQISEARAGAFPQLSLSTQYIRYLQIPVMFIPPNTPGLNPGPTTGKFKIGMNNAYAAGITLAQPLFNLKVNTALDIAETYKSYTDESYKATRQQVIFNVKKAFYGVLLTKKLVEANKQGLEIVRANYENVQSLFKHGNAAEFDVLRAEVQLANTEPLLISAENSLVLALNGLKLALALPIDQDVIVQGEFAYEEVPVSVLDDGRSTAVASNPTLAGLAFQEELLRQNIKIHKADLYPSLALFGSYQWQTQDNTFNLKQYQWANTANIGLSLSFTIFDGFRASSQVNQAEADYEKMKFMRRKAEDGLLIQVQSAELKMNEAKRRLAGQEKTIEQAQKAVRIAQTRYASGVGTQLELLDTQVAMTRAQTTYAQAIYDYLIARAEWEYTVGKNN